jgi:hypothetical protein
MSYLFPTLGTYPHSVIRLYCSICDRREEHRKQTLVAEHGRGVTMLNLLPLIAKCDHRDCRVRYYIQVGQKAPGRDG